MYHAIMERFANSSFGNTDPTAPGEGRSAFSAEQTMLLCPSKKSCGEKGYPENKAEERLVHRHWGLDCV